MRRGPSCGAKSRSGRENLSRQLTGWARSRRSAGTRRWRRRRPWKTRNWRESWLYASEGAPVILVDANLLIYAVNEDAAPHRRAKAWLEAALSGQETVGFSWNVLLAFLRLTTRPGLFRSALTPALAFELMAAWLEQ